MRLTGLSRSRIYELMKSEDIEFVKVGASTLVLVESLPIHPVKAPVIATQAPDAEGPVRMFLSGGKRTLARSSGEGPTKAT